MMLSNDMSVLIEDLADSNELEVRDDYSGRAMFGGRCLGLVGTLPNVAAMLIDMAEYGASDTARQLARRMRVDSMGLEQIVYFPGLQLWEEPEEELEAAEA